MRLLVGRVEDTKGSIQWLVLTEVMVVVVVLVVEICVRWCWLFGVREILNSSGR